MTPVERSILSDFRERVMRRFPQCRMTLFGSRARGDAQPDSDMDVLVVLEGDVDSEADRYVSHCAWEACYEHGIVLSPVVFSRSEWENGPERESLLAVAVRREGVRV